MLFNYLSLSVKSKRSQSALEYMMTYGWAILIIVIVAVILYSMGIFNPSSSITFTSSGFSPFTVSSSLCNNLGYKIAVLAGPIPNNANSITINKVFLTSATGANTTTASYTLTSPVTLKSGQSATILIPNVACNSANIHYSLSAKIQYSYDVPTIGMQTVNTTGTMAGTSISGKPLMLTSYEPITITNTQSSATPNPFQQMINFTSSDPGFSSIATGNFGQNVEFFYYNGTVIPSWLENYTSTNVTWWVKIATIPGGSSETVYIGFAPKSTNLFNTVNDGEAPQLSPTYGEYNNIADVMNTGLLYQFYQLNGGGIQSQATVYQAQLTTNSVFAYGSLTATAGPTLYQSALSGSSQDVNGATDPNVIINYQYSYSGGSPFPNPPISNPQYVIMKAIGFVLVNSPTTIYGLSDDGMGIGYSNGGGSLMPWLGGSSTSNNPNNIINAWVPEGATQYSGTITTDGSYRLEIDYTNQGGPGEDAVWSNTSVDYYSPSQPPNGVMPYVSLDSIA